MGSWKSQWFTPSIDLKRRPVAKRHGAPVKAICLFVGAPQVGDWRDGHDSC
jgi:hypothetical protein